MDGQIDYRLHMQKALRNVMASVLADVAENGLPGEHHFLIAVNTTHPGVDMPDWLRDDYPDEIRLLLQNWFEDLTVAADRFAVTLSFNNQAQRLVVPFEAVISFVDPSVDFGLKLDPIAAEDDDVEDEDIEDKKKVRPVPEETGSVVELDKFRR